jgi:hypothetical protein
VPVAPVQAGPTPAVAAAVVREPAGADSSEGSNSYVSGAPPDV